MPVSALQINITHLPLTMNRKMKKKKKVKLNFSGHNNTANKTSLTPFSM